MITKPSNLIYGLDDKPPVVVSFLLGIQHYWIVAISFIFPVLIIQAIGGTIEQSEALVSMSMLAGGIGVIVQAVRFKHVGAGYFIPQVCGPSFLAASILAVKTGGLSLMFGMTLVAGFFEAAFSRVMHKLRPLFPPQVTGLIVAMVGISVIKIAATNFFDISDDPDIVKIESISVAFLTLGVMAGLNIWSKGKMKLFCILIGMTAGYIFSFIFGVLDTSHIHEVLNDDFFGFGLLEHPGLSFEWSMVLPFFVAMLCSSLKSIGDITTCQKINDENWIRTDFRNAQKGILADSIGCMSAGLLGGMGQSTSSTNIGLTIATGATSRKIGFFLGGILIVMSFLPQLSGLFSIMPRPVMGATLFFALSFMIIAGFQIINSRMVDARVTFTVGLSMIIGLSADFYPHVFKDLPDFLEPVFANSLSTAAVIAIILNFIFRLGTKMRVSKTFKFNDKIFDNIKLFMTQNGGSWGARREIIANAVHAVYEIAGILKLKKHDKPLMVIAEFDEFKLIVEVVYEGDMLDFNQEKPNPETLLNDPASINNLSLHLIKHYADRISTSVKDGRNYIRLSLDH